MTDSKTMTQEEFVKLSSIDQWKWILENKVNIVQIDLDNDVTFINLNETYLTTKEFVGRDQGVKDLLTALGFKAFGV